MSDVKSLAERGLELYEAHCADTFDDVLSDLYCEFAVQNFHKLAMRIEQLEAWVQAVQPIINYLDKSDDEANLDEIIAAKKAFDKWCAEGGDKP